MKSLLPLLGLLLMVLDCRPAHAGTASTNQPGGFRLTVELQDGSRLTGKSREDYLEFRSDVLGKMKLPLEKVRAVESASKTNIVKLTTANADTLLVEFAMKDLRVETTFGEVKVSVSQIRNLQVFPAGVAAKTLPGLVARWPGDGDANEVVGGNNGRQIGRVSYEPGKIGQSFTFDGNTGSGIQLGNPSALQIQDLTVECWIKRSSPTVVSYGDGGHGILFGYVSGGYNVFMHANGTVHLGKADFLETTAGPALTDTNWHHIAVAKSGGIVTVYIDGMAYPASTTFNPGFVFSANCAIGMRADNMDQSFLGNIDEVSVYNRALSAAEIQSLYESNLNRAN